MLPPDYPTDFPTKDKKRGERKAKFQTVKKHAEDIMKNIWKMPQDLIEKYACQNANNLKACNCWMCRNPRRVFKGKDARTIQEKRHDDTENT